MLNLDLGNEELTEYPPPPPPPPAECKPKQTTISFSSANFPCSPIMLDGDEKAWSCDAIKKQNKKKNSHPRSLLILLVYCFVSE